MLMAKGRGLKRRVQQRSTVTHSSRALLILQWDTQVNERYVPQLQQVLTWPQSIGIVGGRPSSSLYFVGCQHDQVLYLDPHQAQQVGSHVSFLDFSFLFYLLLTLSSFMH